MVYQYVVTLQNRNRALIDRFSILLTAASWLIFLIQYITESEKRWIHLAGILLIAVLLTSNLYKQFRLKQPVFYNYLLMISGLIWASMPFYPWLSLLLLIMGLFERQAKKNLEIGFSDQQIVMNSFPRKTYDWSDFTNIVLLDNLLTLDFADNRLFQRETIDEEGDAEEDEFNEYCRQRLTISLHRQE
jgi:hypothetical protein